MNSADRLAFRNLYLRRLLRALRSVSARSVVAGSNLGKRRRAIKLAADVSLALTAKRSLWSRHALANNLYSKKNKSLVERIAGRRKVHSILASMQKKKKKLRGTGIRRCCFKTSFKYSQKLENPMRQKRTRELRRLIPGGESIRSSCLLRETVDYIISLKTQVEVMQSLANSLQQLRHSV